MRLASIVAVLLLVDIWPAPVNSWAGSPDEAKPGAGKPSTGAETLEAAAGRLKKAIGRDWRLSTSRTAFESRRHIAVNLRTRCF